MAARQRSARGVADESWRAWRRVSAQVREGSVRRRLAPGQAWPERRRDYFVLWLIVAGRGVVTLEDRDVAVHADMGVLAPAGLRHRLTAQSDRSVEVIMVPFDLLLDQRPVTSCRRGVDLKVMSLRLHGVPELSLHGAMGALNFGQVILRSPHAMPADLAALECQIQVTRALFMLRQAATRAERDYPQLLTKPPVRRAYVYLLSKADRSDVRLKDIAEHMGLSVPHLIRRFRQEYGSSPMKVLARERLSRARKLLATPEFKIAEVAQATGFASAAYFCRTFRSEVGMTPGEYRRTIAPTA